MKTLFAKTGTKIGLYAIACIFAVSCATAPKQYHVEIVDSPAMMQKQEASDLDKGVEKLDTYERFPYLEYPGEGF